MERQHGYYWVQLKEEKSRTIMHWNGLFWKYNYPYQVDTIFDSEILEVGERIPSNEELKELKNAINEAASICYGEDQNSYNKITALLEKLNWLPE